MMKTSAVVLALLCVAAMGVAEPGDAPGDAVLGMWVTEGGKGRVEVSKEKDGTYTATIRKLKEKFYPEGDPEAGAEKHDRYNQDESLRDRPVEGMKVMWGFEYVGKGSYKKGTIYDPENGKTYSCKMTLASKDDLHIRGYIGISLLGRSTVWKRYVPEEDEKADAEKEAA